MNASVRAPLTLADYDPIFRAATAKHLPVLDDWRILKAQCYQESVFNPRAVSPAGAKGLMQLMDGTRKDIERLKGGPEINPFDPESSIFAGAWYMAMLWSEWKSPRPAADRLALTLASYNAGIGSLLKAQKEAGNPSEYNRIILGLPLVTKERSQETINYVRRIFGYYHSLVVGES